MKSILNKARMLGLTVEEIPTSCAHSCYLVSKSEKEYIIYIPDNVDNLMGHSYTIDDKPWFQDWIIRLQGASVIKIVGGKNVKDASSLFSECETDLLDLSQFNTSNITNMYGMFLECQAKYIDLSNFDTSNVEDMDEIFDCCEAQIRATDPKILQAYKERYVDN